MAKDTSKTNEKNIRAPIVTFMGHVDHGKTSILDAIRKTNVQKGEYGGITQHIGAYQITHNGKKITFIDTPGHSAFTQMRARGGKAADIVVLVVAANDGVMPQTKEAISHAKSAGAPMIVAINKIDVTGADPQKVKQQLAQENVLVEDWGGEVMCIEMSAKTEENLDKLLDAILLLSEMHEFEGDPQGELEAIIIESKLDPKRGVVVTCIVRNGTIKMRQTVVGSGCECKVKMLLDHQGNSLKEAGPSTPVEILGFKELPRVGDLIVEEGSDLAELSEDTDRTEIIGKNAKKTISLVLKADTQGTLEAVKASLADLVTSSVEATYALKFLHTGTGDITDSDAMLAQSVNGIVFGFNVNIPSSVTDFSDNSDIKIKSYQTIYDLIDDAKKLLEGTALEEEAKIKGRAEVIKTFKLRSGDIIAGCNVIAGSLKPGMGVKIFDKNPADVNELEEPLFVAQIKKLKVNKDEVGIVGKNNECGVLLKPQFDDITRGHWFEAI